MIEVPTGGYTLEAGGYTYEVERVMGREVTVRCRHTETGTTAEANGEGQYAARQRARLRVEEILDGSALLSDERLESLRRSRGEHSVAV